MPSRRLKIAAPFARPWSPTNTERLVVRRAAANVVSGSSIVDPLDAVAHARLLPMVELGVVDALDLEHLQLPAVEQPARLHRVLRREVAVEARGEVEVVLGQVEDAARGVDVDRLVREAAGRTDRDGVRCPPGPQLTGTSKM